jgi:carboxylate-amine ligase
VPSTGCGYRFGIEEEFFLVHAESGRLARRAPRALVEQARRELGRCISGELLQSQLEISSPILQGGDSARLCMNGLRRDLAALVARFDLRLLAAGTHPRGGWRAQHPNSSRRYREMVEDFQIVARRSLVCGLHVHVELPPEVERVQVMNRVLPWLPLFLALSTSSPFWDRHATGLKSYRQSMYDEWPRTGIPDAFADEAEYLGFVELLQRSGAIRDAGSIWWGIRPSMKFPTLELRICDACTRLRDSLAIAALFRCALRLLVREPALNADRSAMTRRVIDENRWRAKRFGLAAEFVREDADPQPATAMLADLRERCAPDAEALGCGDALRGLDRLLVEGTSADVQSAIDAARRQAGDGSAQALGHVLRWLMDTTLETA